MRTLSLLLLSPLVIAADGEARLGCGFGAGTSIVDGDGDGYGSTIDCDDADPAINPVADELCDGIDNDCDERVDEDALDATIWYQDMDGDGWGAEGNETSASCSAPDGYGPPGDCYDHDPRIAPDEDEQCDGIDNDCDGRVDEDPVGAPTGCLDADRDGYGDPAICETACRLPSGFVEDDSDCDDGDPAVHPGATEVCNDIDDDCDGVVDPQAGDADGDGWDGCGGDCAPDDPAVHPGAAEICGNGVDDDCSGAAGDCGLEGASGFASHGLTLVGVAEGGSAGRGVAGVGDIDGDGLDDLAIGAPWYEGASSDRGAVYLVHGDAALRGYDTLGLDAAASLILLGAASLDQLGWSVAGAGDTDGDGLSDMIIGAPFDASMGFEGGAAYLVPGAALVGRQGAWPVDLLGYRLSASAAHGQLGWSVAGVGDTDGDGFDDLLLGAPQDDAMAAHAGAAYLVRGPILGDASMDQADACWASSTTDDGAGLAVSGVGDTDGDGLSDMLIGAYRRDAGYPDVGAVALVRGASDLEGCWNLFAADLVLVGRQQRGFLGTAVAGAGDVDGDGLDDLLVGEMGRDEVNTDVGGAWLVCPGATSGSAYIEDVERAFLRGDEPYGYMGDALAGLGDVNGDGHVDVAVGGALVDGEVGANAGLTAVLLGPLEGTVLTRDADALLWGGAAGHLLGEKVAGAGDLDGDGYSDLLMGAPGWDGTGGDVGAAWLIWGGLGL